MKIIVLLAIGLAGSFCGASLGTLIFLRERRYLIYTLVSGAALVGLCYLSILMR